MVHKAFVSSTFKDLQDHRNHVIASLRSAGVFVDPMEEWTAATDEPKQFSQDRIKDCDLCVLLVGFRRGHVPTDEKLSITQLEYRTAVDLGIDVLVFMLKEESPWPREFDELDTDPEIRRWRGELLEHRGVGFFGLEPSSIEIAPALTRWIASQDLRRRGKNILVADGDPTVGTAWSSKSENIGRYGHLDVMMKILEVLEKDLEAKPTAVPPQDRSGVVNIIERLEGGLWVNTETEEVNVGSDRFENITNSIIATRGSIAKGLITVREKRGDEIADAISTLEDAISGTEIEEETKKEALELLQEIANHAGSDQPSKSVIRSLGESLWKAVDGLDSIAGTVSKTWPLLESLWV